MRYPDQAPAAVSFNKQKYKHMTNTKTAAATMTQPVTTGSRWPRRILALVSQAVFTLAVIAAYSWIDNKINHPTVDGIIKFSMRMTRELGARSKASRCAGDCVQMGDTYTALTWGGPISSTTSIYVFHYDQLLVSCENCTMLTIVIPSMGKFDVIGASLPHRCQTDKTSFDSLAASVAGCGLLEHASFEVR